MDILHEAFTKYIISNKEYIDSKCDQTLNGAMKYTNMASDKIIDKMTEKFKEGLDDYVEQKILQIILEYKKSGFLK